jgi:hypothetical protein
VINGLDVSNIQGKKFNCNQTITFDLVWKMDKWVLLLDFCSIFIELGLHTTSHSSLRPTTLTCPSTWDSKDQRARATFLVSIKDIQRLHA